MLAFCPKTGFSGRNDSAALLQVITVLVLSLSAINPEAFH